MSAHPLTAFASKTFGRQFGELILAGYGREAGERQRGRLHVTGSDNEEESNWTIELVASRLPCRDEPLGLAALLKLLLGRPRVSHLLEFESGELLRELRWRDGASTRQEVETAILGYVRLLYDKQAVTKPGRGTPAAVGGGYYHLLTGYVRGTQSHLSSVYFDVGFVEGLNRGRVCFAGIDFGLLNSGRR